MLRTLHVVSHEGNIQRGGEGAGVSGAVYLDLVDDAVWQALQRALDVQDELVEIGQVIEVNNGDSGEGLIQSRGESKGESLAGNVVSRVWYEGNLLHLVLGSSKHVQSLIHHISAILAHSLGAIHIAILSITHATSGFLSVPLIIVEGLWQFLLKITINVVLRD